MDESRRFLRYVMPGLVFAVQAGVFVYIVYPEQVWEQFEKFGKDGIGAAVASFLISGALGYIFASMHHQWVRRWPAKMPPPLSAPSGTTRRTVLDYSEWVNDRILDGNYPGHPGRTDPQKRTKLERLDAEALVWKDWYRRVEDGTIAKAVEAKVESLADQAHGFGAARVASVCALIVSSWYCFVYRLEFDWAFLIRVPVAFAFSLFAWYSFSLAYQRLGTLAQRVFEHALGEAFDEELKPPTP
jgi:hypothetical protein